MLDINFIRENPDKVKQGVTVKGYDASLVNKVLDLDKRRRELVQLIENLRTEKNKTAKEKDVEKGKQIKAQLRKYEPELEEADREFNEAMLQIPNLPADDVTPGKDESDNKVLREGGKKIEFNFTPKDHLELGQALDILDFERGSKVAGSGFYYLKNKGVLLEFALIQYGIEFLREKEFIPTITPDVAREKDTDLGLIATSEVTLAGFHADEVLNESDLPRKYGGYSHCFRVESGGYGKYSKGLYRVHQFAKVEMYVYCKPEESKELHQELLALEEEFWKSLGVPYRVVEMCTGDLGAQAARKFDLEAWMPGRGDWGEVTSTSDTTDYQTRRLNIKYRKGGENQFLHTLNGTLVATPRAIIAILENFQQEDGAVAIPEVLQKYTGFSLIKPKQA
ncbi:serine--tRNA ligase [Candidatus Microgenomates bacterium]|nr:serine--tRNA ligase [Candidatus Microgenomates bacterium]